jgi:uncharacterized membrane protein YgcG
LKFGNFKSGAASMPMNPDGSVDDWHAQPLHYGIALADLILILPVTILAYTFYFCQQFALAHYVFSLIASWLVYCNLFTTATSLKFQSPVAMDWDWFISYPFGAVLGALYLTWVLTHFEAIFGHAPPELLLGSGDGGGAGGGYTHVPDANSGSSSGAAAGDWWRR